MAGHDWKKVILPDDFLGNVTDMLKFRWLPTNPQLSNYKIWECGRCGGLIVAVGSMSQSDARRKAGVPFDCHLQIVRMIHGY